MRKFKFRVWSHNLKHFLNGGVVIQLDGQIDEVRAGEFLGEEPNAVIQQFTGLLDKNNKDIYEGDILKCIGHDGWFDSIGYYYNMEVKFKLIPSGDSDIAGYIHIPQNREIIGNIFENPELLKMKA